MKKDKRNKIDDLNIDEREIFEVIEKEIKIDFEDFDIDISILDNLDIPDDLDSIIDKVVDKVDKENKKQRAKRIYVAVASIVCIILGIGIYNPALAHKIPIIHKVLEVINKTLKVDEVTQSIGVNKVIPKVELNEQGELEVLKLHITKEKDVKEPIDERGTINLVHAMSNSIIKAQDIWSCTEITPKTIDMVLQGIENMSDIHKSYLKPEIEKWKSGDFDNAKEVHNYVWKLLNGTIGEAYDINRGNINEIKEKYFSN